MEFLILRKSDEFGADKNSAYNYRHGVWVRKLKRYFVYPNEEPSHRKLYIYGTAASGAKCR